MPRRESILFNWLRFLIFLVAIGILFGSELAFGILKGIGEIAVAIFIGMGLLYSIHLVYEYFERKSGEATALIYMFAYVIFGLPVIILALRFILKPLFRILE